MKKSIVKALSISLCALLALGGLGATVYAATASGNPAPAVSGEREAKTPAPGGERNVKDETVYVLARADGTVEKLIISDWIQNANGSARIDDVTGLSAVENVKGDESFTRSGDSACVWDAQGNDIYYQGSIDKELPVSVSVSYTLDGRPISPADLAGKSGRVTIRFDYVNRQYELVDIGGKQEKIYVPFAMLTGLLLDNDVFSNVAVTNGRLVNDGDRTIVAGLALPGLQDSLGLDRDDLELPDYVEITADVENFELETAVVMAANRLLGGELDRSGGIESLDDWDGRLGELTGAMTQLIDGSSQLYDGLCDLLDGAQELTAGAGRLEAGAAQLRQGADSLAGGASQLQTGSAALRQGLEQLDQSSDALNAGADQVFQSLLASANAQLASAGTQAPELTAENYAQVLEGVIAAAGESPAAERIGALKASLDSYNSFYTGLRGYTAGVAQSAAGAGQLDDGIGDLKNGADGLSAGAGQLYDGVRTMQEGAPALTDGVTRLRDGAMELNSGLKEFNEEGVQKLVDAFGGGLDGLVDRVNAVKAVSERYQTFSGLSPDMDGQVKFIWRTDAVEIQQ